jgi:hypothetical protein
MAIDDRSSFRQGLASVFYLKPRAFEIGWGVVLGNYSGCSAPHHVIDKAVAIHRETLYRNKKCSLTRLAGIVGNVDHTTDEETGRLCSKLSRYG